MKHIGIIGGTFDPIHYGHLRIAQIALEEHELDEIVFIPSGNPPHKLNKKITDGKHRLEMVQLAVKDNPYFIVSDYEIYQSKVTYTIDTIREMKACYEEGTKFYFIIGADAFLDMDYWHNLDNFLKMVDLIVLSRSYYKTSKVEDKIKDYSKRYECSIQTVYAKTLNVSATAIRKLAGWNKSIKYLVPDEVDEYIKKNSLYKNEDSE